VILALSDTHADGPHEFSEHLAEQIRAAEAVCHAGDFTSVASLEAVEGLADRLVAVHGNADGAAVRERLPATATLDALGRRFLVVHGHEHDETSLSLLARQEGADVVVTGHTHRPGVGAVGPVTVVNPGSHADPRGARPAYAWVGAQGRGVMAGLRTPTGESIGRQWLSEGQSGSTHSE